jgi:hypothetical protein
MKGRYGVADDRRQRMAGNLEILTCSGLNAGEVKQLVDQIGQTASLTMHRSKHVLRPLGGKFPQHQKFRKTHDAGHGGAQFVGRCG